jgi:hypothetical protein
MKYGTTARLSFKSSPHLIWDFLPVFIGVACLHDFLPFNKDNASVAPFLAGCGRSFFRPRF